MHSYSEETVNSEMKSEVKSEVDSEVNSEFKSEMKMHMGTHRRETMKEYKCSECGKALCKYGMECLSI